MRSAVRPRRGYSLLVRLSVAFTILAIMVLSLAGGLLYHSLWHQLRQRDDDEITVKLNEFLNEARNLGSAQAVARNEGLFREAMLSHPDIVFGIFDARGGALVQSAKPQQRFTRAEPDNGTQGQPYSCSPPSVGASRCIYADEILVSGQTIRVQLAHVARVRDAVLSRYRDDIWLVLLGGSVLMGVLGYVIARRGLRPVRLIGRQISRIEAHNLGERVDMGVAPVELRDIGVPVNRMLDRLERAFSRLSQFSSDVAHDMRTPLANLISASQVTLSRERSHEEYQALIESNVEECERLQRMIETMLFLARVDHAQQPLKLADLACESEFAKLFSYFEGVAEEKGIRLVIDGALQVHADPTMFRRAVGNLVSNALDHAAAESDVVLRAYRSADQVAVAVTNHGGVIPPEHIDKIFDRFYRVNASRQGSAKNMGLGLAIVKSIMELHHGRVEVVSGADVTTFTLYFPTSTVVSTPEAASQAANRRATMTSRVRAPQ